MSATSRDDGRNHQLPGDRVAPEFGEVNVRRDGGRLRVELTILMEPQGEMAEGWQTGVALDASSSMMDAYGRLLRGGLPARVADRYRAAGWLADETADGRTRTTLTDRAIAEAVAEGHLRWSENVIEPLARKFIAYLAGNLDADGGTTVAYWACGDGGGVEPLGDFTAERCAALEIRGPRSGEFGTGTRLWPAVEFFLHRFPDAPRGMYLFVTDGRLDDLPAVCEGTRRLAADIAAGRRRPVKCVLIGVGDGIDEAQMETLDDLDTGTDVDVWDHKIAAEMRGLTDIFAEVVDENTIVAPEGTVYGPDGRPVRRFDDGLPAKLGFDLPAGSTHFELEVAGRRIRQPLA
jgi:hypothetical protein